MTRENAVPIEPPEPPQPSIDALQAVLPALMGSAGVRQSAPGFAASLVSSPRVLSSPGLSYPVYMLGLDSVAAGASLSKAKLAAWRHEFSSGGEVVAAEVSAGRQPRFSGLNVSSRFRSVSQELRSATETGKGFVDQSYQPRLLQISALGIRALWLKSAPRSQADIVIPLAPTRPELTANRHYSPAEFIEAVRPAAEALLRAEAPGKGA
jgi:hypothetical protein